MLKRFLYLIIFFSGFGLLALGQPALAESSSSAVKNSFAENSEPDFLPPDQAFKLNIEATSANSLEAQFTIVPGYYLYKSRIKFGEHVEIPVKDTIGRGITSIDFPKGDIKDDPNFGKMEVYHHDFTAKINVANAAQNIAVEATYQGCSEKGLCYPPQHKTFNVAMNDAGTNAVLGANKGAAFSASTEDDKTTQALKSGNLWLVIAGFFVAGLLLSFTPCVLPMIPILSSIIVGSQSKQAKPSKLHAFGLSVAYVLGMAISYSLAGVAAGLSGNLLSQSLQNGWVLGATALLFVALAFSMFGFYQLKLPAAFESKILNASNQLKGGEFLGVFIMGALSALVVSPCIAAPLVGALIYIGQTHNVFLGGVGLFALALGMGVPLLLIGASAGRLLPKAGAWMTTVRNFFGVLMLAMAAYIAWPVLPHALTQPVNQLFEAKTKLPFTRIKTVADLDNAIKNANGKPVMLDFYADWCTSCKEMEKLTFSDAKVQATLKNVILLQADVTDQNDDDKTLLKRFNIIGPPTIVFFGSNGQELKQPRVVGFENAAQFLATLNQISNQN